MTSRWNAAPPNGHFGTYSQAFCFSRRAREHLRTPVCLSSTKLNRAGSQRPTVRAPPVKTAATRSHVYTGARVPASAYAPRKHGPRAEPRHRGRSCLPDVFSGSQDVFAFPPRNTRRSCWRPSVLAEAGGGGGVGSGPPACSGADSGGEEEPLHVPPSEIRFSAPSSGVSTKRYGANGSAPPPSPH